MNPADPETMEWTVVPQLGAAVKVDREYPTALFVTPLFLDGHFDPEDVGEVDFYRAFDTDEEKKLWEQLRDTLLALDRFYNV